MPSNTAGSRRSFVFAEPLGRVPGEEQQMGALYHPRTLGYLHEMDARTVLAIFASTAIAGIIRVWWSNFKERKALEPTPLKLRKGVHVSWGPVEEIKHYGWRLFQFWLVYMAFWIVVVIYVRLIAPNL